MIKKSRKSGNNYRDWEYYDEFGNLIEDLILMELLFGVFSDGEWSNDVEYAIDDIEYYTDSTTIDEEPSETIQDDTTTVIENEEPSVTEPEYEEPKHEEPTFTEPKYEEPTFTEPSFDEDDTKTSSFGSGSDSYDSGSDFGGSDFGGDDF